MESNRRIQTLEPVVVVVVVVVVVDVDVAVERKGREGKGREGEAEQRDETKGRVGWAMSERTQNCGGQTDRPDQTDRPTHVMVWVDRVTSHSPRMGEEEEEEEEEEETKKIGTHD